MKLSSSLILFSMTHLGLYSQDICSPEVSIKIPKNLIRLNAAEILQMEAEDKAKLTSASVPLADFSILCHFNLGANQQVPFIRIIRQTLPFSKPSEAHLTQARQSLEANGMTVEKISYDDVTLKLLIASSWNLPGQGKVKNIQLQRSTNIYNYSLQIRFYENGNTFDAKSIMASFDVKQTSEPPAVTLPVDNPNWQKPLFWTFMFLCSILVGVWVNKSRMKSKS